MSILVVNCSKCQLHLPPLDGEAPDDDGGDDDLIYAWPAMLTWL